MERVKVAGAAGASMTLGPPSRIGLRSAAAVRTGAADCGGRTLPATGGCADSPSSQSFWSLMAAIIVAQASMGPASEALAISENS